MNIITRNLLNSRVNLKTCINLSKRPFWHWLNHVWNEVDKKRIEEVGPNRAAAEWLLRCGAQIKLKNWGNYVNDYNKLPPGGNEAFQIVEIRAENSCIMARGFEYLHNLNNLKTIKFVNCELIDDAALAKLSYVRDTLEELQIVFCPSVSDMGLTYLYLLTGLKKLVLIYLPNVKDYELSKKLLHEKLPNCKILFTQKEPTEEDLDDI